MYSVGQRWLSEAETDLGLGLVQHVDFRVVTLYFPVVDDVRSYSRESAPLTRVVFKIGDTVPLADGSVLEVAEVNEADDIIFYSDGEQLVSEIHLSGQIQLNLPSDRLFTGQIDHNNLFELRQFALKQLSTLRSRPYYGLLGARTSLLPHQLHIASQVTQDALPRVLLADEVGLGKTIEAGLILHRLLLQQRIERVLVIVPDALIHQWLVEMIRRFNLRFTIIDDGLVMDTDDLFASGQLFLCPLSLAEDELVSEQMLASEFDMLVVDEAHHLHWSEDGDSNDSTYELVEELSLVTPGLMLLTATPEQLGVQGHYARLRLLDPERYPSLQQFLDEQKAYQPIAELAGVLASDQNLSSEQQQYLSQLLPEEDVNDLNEADSRNALLSSLIDRHGPGRALFRNTRQGVAGFPARIANISELSLPSDTDDLPTEDLDLFPEAGKVNWCENDARLPWLLDLLKDTGKEKLVLICHHAQTVLDIERWLWENEGIPTAVFHEDMDLIERDRAAAYFADQQQGARLLLCSEIGSEGRNFQFAHHLVLFDLPFNCDLIEQRIGRLDRIGQKQDIQIHIPTFADHATGRWAQILEQGLDLFSRPNPAAQPLLEKNQTAIEQALASGEGLAELLEQLSEERQTLMAQLEAGRDRLLELHSCHPTRAKALAKEMTITHIQDEAELNDFIELFADAFGLEVMDLGGDCITIMPGDHMLVPDLPHLPEDGFMATTRREVALSRDDVQFLSWEHPFIDQALELITSSPVGNAAVGYIENHDHKTGDCYLELQFVARCPAPKYLAVERFLPPNAMYLMMSPSGDLKVNEEGLPGFVLHLKRGTARGLIDQKQASVEPVIHKLEKLGSGQLSKIVERSMNKAVEAYDNRLNRLKALSQQNPNMSKSLVENVSKEQQAVLQALSQAQLELDSVRMVFCS